MRKTLSPLEQLSADNDAGLVFMTGGNATLVCVGVLQQLGYEVTFLSYFLQNGIPNLLLDAICVFVALKMFAPKEAKSSEAYIKEQYLALGPISRNEKKAILLLLITVILLLTQNLHKFAPGSSAL